MSERAGVLAQRHIEQLGVCACIEEVPLTGMNGVSIEPCVPGEGWGMLLVLGQFCSLGIDSMMSLEFSGDEYNDSESDLWHSVDSILLGTASVFVRHGFLRRRKLGVFTTTSFPIRYTTEFDADNAAGSSVHAPPYPLK